MTSKRRSPLASVRNGPTKRIDGFYVHSSRPKVLQVNSSVVRNWLQEGNVSLLEKIVLEGRGRHLLGADCSDPKIRRFLRRVPGWLQKIDLAHEAAARGDVATLEEILEKSNGSTAKIVFLSENPAGIGLLHRAAFHGRANVVKFLVSNFPRLVNAADKEGKRPLHYCGASEESKKIWQILVESGADPESPDSKGNSPIYYMQFPKDISFPPDAISIERSNAGENHLRIKPSNIRIWIHRRDFEKLRRVIWEGHGDKLLAETSNNAKVKRFLEGVPVVLNAIKDLHSAVIDDDFESYLANSSDPLPVEILASRDANGLNALHKAAGLGRFQMVKDMVERNGKLVFSRDEKGRTPLHFAAAAAASRDDDSTYKFLVSKTVDETVKDSTGKTPARYKSNPREISKLLKVVPDAPRTSLTFDSLRDWTLLESSDRSTSTSRSPLNGETVIVGSEESVRESKSEKNGSDQGDDDEILPADFDRTEKATEVVEDGGENENGKSVSSESGEENANSPEHFDLWTNEDDGLETESGDPKKGRIDEKDDEDTSEGTDEAVTEVATDNGGGDEEARMKEKTEREIGEERQRLLDEGLLRVEDAAEEIDGEKDEIKRMIDEEDMEGLASMVLNGEGEKLLGRRSEKPEVRAFLENLPSYLEKIASVHEAVRRGSLKKLQATLDRRRFAAAREPSDKLGVAPLHVAVLLRKPQIVKYLGSRFPETLNLRDNFGRTALHYAATLPDGGHTFDALLNLGADRKAEDDAGMTAGDYREDSEAPTYAALLEDFDAAAHLARDMLTGEENVLFGSEDGKYLANELGSPLVNGLAEIASKRPTNPIASLADFLYDFVGKNKRFDSSPREEEEAEPEVGTGKPEMDTGIGFDAADRDEFGQSVLHFAAARAHGRTGIFQLMQESNINLGYRDELYRTARDVAAQAELKRNVDEIDNFVISLTARGETEKIRELFLEGYDHITDLKDDKSDDVIAIAARKNQRETVAFLKAIPNLEASRDRVHKAIRAGNVKSVHETIEGSKNGRIAAIGKNARGRCSLHVAILCQQKEIARFLARKFPESLRIGDNLERTPMHYAMGVDEIETLSGILIECGAERLAKDLKGRQPTYYFMNKSEILRLQEEEEKEMHDSPDAETGIGH